MTFTTEQIAALDAPLSKSNVKRNPRGFDYVESWHAEAEANRIFGFDGWSSIVLESKCVVEAEAALSSGKGWTVSYIATVRVTVDGVQRDGAGAGHGKDRDLGLAHESALKEAASDAEKRALKTFGNQFGLALYDKTRENVTRDPPEPQKAPLTGAGQSDAPRGIARLNAAQAKRVNLDRKIADQIWACKTRTELAEWDREFDKHTAEAPQGWLDSIRNDVILRGEEIDHETAGSDMDEAFKATVGPAAH